MKTNSLMVLNRNYCSRPEHLEKKTMTYLSLYFHYALVYWGGKWEEQVGMTRQLSRKYLSYQQLNLDRSC